MVKIRFREIRVGTVSRASAVHSGDNRIRRFAHKGKQNMAFGTFEGAYGLAADIRTVLNDADGTDTGWPGKPDGR